MVDSTEPPRSIEEVKAMLETTEKGGFRNSMSNCLTVFQCDPLLSGAVAYNLLTDRTDILKPIGYKRTAGSPMTDTDMKYIRLYLEKTYGLTSEKKIQDAADLAANLKSCSVWWAVREPGSPPSSACWQSKTSGSPMTCGSWTMTTYTANSKATG